MAQQVDPEVARKELNRLLLLHAQARMAVDTDLKEQQRLIRSYLGASDGFETQKPDDIPLPETPTGPSPLFQAITKLAEKTMQSDEPDPMLVGWAALGEKKWTEKQRMAMWLLCTTRYRETLREMGIDAITIPKPDLTT